MNEILAAMAKAIGERHPDAAVAYRRVRGIESLIGHPLWQMNISRPAELGSTTSLGRGPRNVNLTFLPDKVIAAFTFGQEVTTILADPGFMDISELPPSRWDRGSQA